MWRVSHPCPLPPLACRPTGTRDVTAFSGSSAAACACTSTRPKAGRGTGCRVRSQPAQFSSVRLAIPPAQARLTCLQTWVLPNRVGEEANSNTLVRTVKGASGQVCCFMAPLRAPEFGLSSALPLWLYFVMQMSQAFNPPPPPLCCREGAEAWQALMLASSASSPLEPESPFCFEQQFAHQPSEG